MRILFATLVLLAHAPEMTDNGPRRELLHRLLHTDYNFGAFGVDGFFLLSGFLIVQSWLGDPEFLNYLRKRVLRIVPGYVVAALLSTLAAGLAAPGVDHYFRHLHRQFFTSILMLGTLATPPAYVDIHLTNTNGSLWTIPYEFRCYLIVAIWGLCGLFRFRRSALWLAATVVLLVLMFFPVLTGPPEGWHEIYYLTGQPPEIARLTATFFAGSCFYLFRRHIPFRPALALASTAVIVAVAVFNPNHIEVAVVTCGAYLMFYLGQLPSITLDWMKRVPDISYGIYLYGGPVESLWIWYHRNGSPWITFLAATIISYALGWLSWHLVERPMLTLKRRPTAPLPPP
jgi:peptidoglycan/LPS O-acetylase OafA/YrhL